MTSGSDQDKTLAMLCHLLALAGFVVPLVGNIVGPLILWALKKDQSELINIHGKESLNFQITMSIAGIVAFILSFVLIGIPLLFAIGIFDVVMVIIASIKVANGEKYTYPFSLKLIK